VSSSHYCINIASSFDLKLPRVNSWLQGLYSTERVLAVSQIGDAGNLKFSNSVDKKNNYLTFKQQINYYTNY
jgi:hypothetical protein